jgi:hypothetical protein
MAICSKDTTMLTTPREIAALGIPNTVQLASSRAIVAMVHFNRAAQFPTISTAPGIESLRDSANTPYLPATKTTGDFLLPFDVS